MMVVSILLACCAIASVDGRVLELGQHGRLADSTLPLLKRRHILQEALIDSVSLPRAAAGPSAGLGEVPATGAVPGTPAPAAGADVQYFVFGYGSLLEKFSRMKTDCGVKGVPEYTLGAIFQQDALVEPYGPPANVTCTTPEENIFPARVAGVDRGWYAPGSHINPEIDGSAWANNGLFLVPTYLGAFESDDSSVTCNGIIYSVSPAQYELQVARETMANYTVVELTKERITQLGGTPLPSNAKVIYFASDKSGIKYPTARAPIVQSYVDVTMGGCLQLQDRFNLTKEGGYTGNYPSFVEEFVGTTRGWSENWVNDRQFPYRPFVANPYAERINRALFNQLAKDTLQKISAVPITSPLSTAS